MTIEQRNDGALLIRVHSSDSDGHQLPDAVFTFRAGDPQFEHWQDQFALRQCQVEERRDTSHENRSRSLA